MHADLVSAVTAPAEDGLPVTRDQFDAAVDVITRRVMEAIASGHPPIREAAAQAARDIRVLWLPAAAETRKPPATPAGTTE